MIFARLFIVVLFLMATPSSLGAMQGETSMPEEPPVAAVLQEALRYARLEPHTISQWKRNTRRQALLPKLQFDYSHDQGSDLDVDINDSVYVGSGGVTIGPKKGSFAQNLKSGNSVGVRAIWDLNELIFSQDELRVSYEARMLARDRRLLLDEVNKQFHRRQRIKGELALLKARQYLLKPGEKHEHIEFLKQIELQEATAALDAATGGWFSRQMGETS